VMLGFGFDLFLGRFFGLHLATPKALAFDLVCLALALVLYVVALLTYLLRLSSSLSKWNIGRRVVMHLARSLAVSLASLLSTPIVSKSSFSVSCHVLIGLPTFLLPPSGIHSTARALLTVLHN